MRPWLYDVLNVVLVLGVPLTMAAGLIWVERRLLALWQDRVGPNRVGPFGLLQPVADALKLFFKEDWVPPQADRWVFVLAPGIVMVTVLMSFAVVPVAPGEDWSISGRQTFPGMVVATEQGLRYRHAGDYPEDRLVWRKVRLPRGAHVVSTSPEPTAVFEDDTFIYVMWRQFYKQGEMRNLDVVYTLD